MNEIWTKSSADKNDLQFLYNDITFQNSIIHRYLDL